MPSPPTKGDWKFLIGHGESGSRGGSGKRIGGTRITASASADTTSIRRGGAWFSWCHMAEMNPSRLVRPSPPCSLEREEGGRTRKRWHTKAGGDREGRTWHGIHPLVNSLTNKQAGTRESRNIFFSIWRIFPFLPLRHLFLPSFSVPTPPPG